MITIFRNIKTPNQPNHRSLKLVLDRIRKGKSKLLVEQIRLVEDKNQRNSLKSLLPCICFSGTFDKRNNASLRVHSGLICLDFDDTGAEYKKVLEKDEYIYSAFVSPSGNGVKALVKIPRDSRLDHYASFLALQERYPNIDKGCKDVARICYESYDPDIYVNEDSKVFEKQIIKEVKSYEVSKPETNQDKIYENIKKWMDNNCVYFSEGNRNNFLAKIAGATNRFGISKERARDYLMYDFVNGSSDFKISELDAVLKSIYSLYSGQFNTASFDKKEIVDKVTKKVISKEVYDLTLPAKDVIYLNDICRDMLKTFVDGITKHETTCIPAIDRIFRWNKQDLNCFFGVGNGGKSALMNYLLMMKAVQNDWKFAFYSPEADVHKFYNDLIQLYVGLPLFGYNKMSKAQYVYAMKFINERFFYIDTGDTAPTPDYLLERFHEIIAKHNVDAVVLDPWNQLTHLKRGVTKDEYLSEELRKIKMFAKKNNVIFNIVAHCNSSLSFKADGNLEMPYAQKHLADGPMWRNKCDNIVAYHRPEFRTNPENTYAVMSSQKIKNETLGGKKGEVDLYFDRDTFRFKLSDDEPVVNFVEVRDQMSNIELDFINPDRQNNNYEF